jgi:carbamoyltransferase
VQTVDEQRHGRYYRMMRRFHQLTGSPVIINTSFNIRGEPIVCTPEDAYRCFMGTDMDCLVIEDFILMKEDQPEGFLLGIENYQKNMTAD